jgi:hypothetical protein
MGNGELGEKWAFNAEARRGRAECSKMGLGSFGVAAMLGWRVWSALIYADAGLDDWGSAGLLSAGSWMLIPEYTSDPNKLS